MRIPKKTTTRAKSSAQKMEAAVTSVGRALERLTKHIEREGAKLKPEQVQKAFGYLTMTTNAAQQKALAAVNAASLSSFSLGMDLPVIPMGAQHALLGPTHLTAPSLVAPTPALAQRPPGVRGPSVEELGGRFVKDVRDARVPGDDTDLDGGSAGTDDEPNFIDDEEE